MLIEYGTTIAEKRSVGVSDKRFALGLSDNLRFSNDCAYRPRQVKICHSLLEKIKFDLHVARTDNDVDMRYLLNMDYSCDLPINSMGRRIRTRLYFTSESHLHTMLNILRFAYPEDQFHPLLSDDGIAFVNSTSELCYLTHLVFRVFEDRRSEMANDPRRFRVEILFSAGATATPLHLDEPDRDFDTSRFDTAPLHVIGREGLTCAEVEEFLEFAISEGQGSNEDEDEDAENDD